MPKPMRKRMKAKWKRKADKHDAGFLVLMTREECNTIREHCKDCGWDVSSWARYCLLEAIGAI